MKRGCVFLSLVAFLAIASVGQAQTWNQIGPAPIDGSRYSTLPNATLSGTVTDIAIDPSGSVDSTIYVATAAGGVWKTTDGGSSWSSTSDSTPILFMGSVSLDPSNPSVVYAGVGGPWCCVSGGGIYRSIDAADHWTLLNPNGIFTGVVINRIVLPASGTLVVATSNGLYKSIDGGSSFGNNAPNFDNGKSISITTPSGVISNGNISDLKIDTGRGLSRCPRVINMWYRGFRRPSIGTGAMGAGNGASAQFERIPGGVPGRGELRGISG